MGCSKMNAFLHLICIFSLFLGYFTVLCLDCRGGNLPVDTQHCIFGTNHSRRCFYICDNNGEPWKAASSVCQQLTTTEQEGRLAMTSQSEVQDILDRMVNENNKEPFWLDARTQMSYWHWLGEDMPVKPLLTYYQGCFLSRTGKNRELNHSSESIGLHTANWCRSHCQRAGYSYFTIRDVQKSFEVRCSCGDKYGEYGEGYGCSKCMDGHQCGSDQLNAVYTVFPGNNETHNYWERNHPVGLGNQQYLGHCMATKTLFDTTVWISTDCNEKRFTYCVKGAPCFQGNIVGDGGRCYVPLRQNLTWPDAVRECRKQEATMITVTSSKVMQELITFARRNIGLGKDSFWLGATTLDWRSQSGDKTAISGNHWADIEQSDPLQGHCLALKRSGKTRSLKWVSHNCTQPAQFICQIESWTPLPSTTESKPNKPTTTLTAAVTEVPEVVATDSPGIDKELIIIVAASIGGGLLLLLIVGLIICCCCCSRGKDHKKEERNKSSFGAPGEVYPEDPHLMHSNGALRYSAGAFTNAYRGMAPPSIISDASNTEPPPEYFTDKTISNSGNSSKDRKLKSPTGKPDIYAKLNKNKKKKKKKKSSNKSKSNTDSDTTGGSMQGPSPAWPDATDEANVAANYATLPATATNPVTATANAAPPHATGYPATPTHPASSQAPSRLSPAVQYTPHSLAHTDYSSNTYAPAGHYSPNPGASSYTANSGYGYSYTDYNYPGSRYGSMPHPNPYSNTQPHVHNHSYNTTASPHRR